MRTMNRDIVSAVIFSKDNKVLLGMKDPKDLIYVSQWGIPGGGVEEGETKMEALAREVKEETSIEIAGYPVELLDDTNTGSSEKRLKETGEVVYVKMNFFTYKVVLTDQNAHEVFVELNDDLVKSQWIDLDKVKYEKLNTPTMWLFKKLKYIT